MILSVSRRTDIPAFYSDWFFERLKRGVVYVQNPFNNNTVYKIELSPSVVDFIVFWTKDPEPMLKNIDVLEKLGYPNYYFLFTLNSYNNLELNLPPLKHRINTFKNLSSKIGADRVIWRYDPIIISNEYDVSFHLELYHDLSQELSGYTYYCKTSFLTHYKKIRNRLKDESVEQADSKLKRDLFLQLKQIAKKNNIDLELCCESIEGVQEPASGCVNKILIEKFIKARLDLKRDKNQRDNCQCISSIDIGAYNTCNHQCLYCYANSGNENKSLKHNIYSPLLAKEFDATKQILYERRIQSNIIKENNELTLF